MSTDKLLTGVGIVVGLIAFGVLAYVEVLNKRDETSLKDLDEFIKRLQISDPVDVPEGSVVSGVAKMLNDAQAEALKINTRMFLDKSVDLRERQRRRRYFTFAGLFLTAAAAVFEFVALFS